MITHLLEPHQCFVFGSNIHGHHVGGAAKQALEQFGAVYGIGVGTQGQCYAIPTMPPLTLKEIGHYIQQFVAYAKLTPETEYLVTAIGTGIAGYTKEEMDSVWPKDLPSNIKRV